MAEVLFHKSYFKNKQFFKQFTNYMADIGESVGELVSTIINCKEVQSLKDNDPEGMLDKLHEMRISLDFTDPKGARVSTQSKEFNNILTKLAVKVTSKSIKKFNDFCEKSGFFIYSPALIILEERWVDVDLMISEYDYKTDKPLKITKILKTLKSNDGDGVIEMYVDFDKNDYPEMFKLFDEMVQRAITATTSSMTLLPRIIGNIKNNILR